MYRLPVGGKAKNPNGALAHFLSVADDTTTGHRWLKFAQEWSVLCICRPILLPPMIHAVFPVAMDHFTVKL